MSRNEQVGQGRARAGIRGRAALLGLAIAAMALALYGGLVRLGVPIPAIAGIESIHGPLMICGVFSTLISLERAVAVGMAWPYAAPACFGFGAVAMVMGVLGPAAALTVAGAAIFLAASVWIARQQPALFTLLLALATLMLLVGCVLWLAGVPVSSLAGWWLGFLVLTIAAERLELSRVMRHTRFAQYLFAGAVILLVAGAALGMDDEVGRQVMGAGYIGVAAWLAQHDVARRTVRIAGQARYMAMAMLAGYCWLPVTGLTLLFGVPGPFAYDISLHAVAIGFVLSMVFGHALIIFPAITGVSLRYWWPLYLPLGLLHFSVVLRVVGDITEIQALRVTSGPLTALSLIVFGVVLVIARRHRQLR